MSKDYLRDACISSIGRPPQLAANSWGAIVVSCRSLCCMRQPSSFDINFPQSATFVVCAAASGWMFCRWRNMSSIDRARVWKHYGLLCGLMCFGSLAGAISYAAWSQFLVALYPGIESSSIESYLSLAKVISPRSFQLIIPRLRFCYLAVYPVDIRCRLYDGSLRML